MSTLSEIHNNFRDISEEHEAELKELMDEFDKEYERTLKEFERSHTEAGKAWGAATAGRTVRHPITGEKLPIAGALTSGQDGITAPDGIHPNSGAGTENGRTSSADTAIPILTREEGTSTTKTQKPSAWPMGGVL